MPIVERSTVIACAITDAFDLSQSYALRLDWDPFVTEQHPVDGVSRPDKGVQTSTTSRHGLKMISEYLTYKTPDAGRDEDGEGAEDVRPVQRQLAVRRAGARSHRGALPLQFHLPSDVAAADLDLVSPDARRRSADAPDGELGSGVEALSQVRAN
ncbi:MAG: hypothetical protein ABIR32_06110 [Ilumatobacteraceae bacterium]